MLMLSTLLENTCSPSNPSRKKCPDLHRKPEQLMIIASFCLYDNIIFITIYLKYNYNQTLKNVLKAQVDAIFRLDLVYSQRFGK